MNYEVSETAIKDKSLLGTQGQKLCENIDVYWMTPTCGTGDSDGRKCSQSSSLFPCVISFVYVCNWTGLWVD